MMKFSVFCRGPGTSILRSSKVGGGGYENYLCIMI